MTDAILRYNNEKGTWIGNLYFVLHNEYSTHIMKEHQQVLRKRKITLYLVIFTGIHNNDVLAD